MAVFSYVGRDAWEKKVAGTVEAPSAEAALQALQTQDLSIDELREVQRDVDQVNWNDEAADQKYLPLSDTLRLYAGWLLALYFFVYAVGSYPWLESVPVSFGFVDELFLSPLILTFTAAAFIYLGLHTLFRYIGGGALRGIGFSLVGIFLFLVFRANM